MLTAAGTLQISLDILQVGGLLAGRSAGAAAAAAAAAAGTRQERSSFVLAASIRRLTHLHSSLAATAAATSTQYFRRRHQHRAGGGAGADDGNNSVATALEMLGPSHRRALHSLASLAHKQQQQLNLLAPPLSHGAVSAAVGGAGLGAGPVHASAVVGARHIRQLFGGRKGSGGNSGGSGGGSNNVDRLYDSAEDNPDNAAAQAKLYGALLHEDPHEVVKRFESGRFASNDTCLKHYVAALVHSKRLQQTNLTYILGKEMSKNSRFQQMGGSSGGSSSSFSGGGAMQIGGGTNDSPLVVTMQEPNFRSQVWRLVRSIIVILILISAFSGIMEEKGIGGAMGKNKDHEITPETLTKQFTFDDVQGADEAKEELMQVVDFLRDPSEFTRLGGRLQKGVLLMGPPGTGKTLLARAVAGEAGVPFFYCSGSEFDEMFVGVGAKRIRELFAAAKKKSPCIIFMDEIDAVGGKRSARDQQYSKMTLNQLLVELDGFHKDDNIVIIAATNFPESLDPALVRPGRFDTHVNVGLPDVRGRAAILKVHAKDVPIAANDEDTEEQGSALLWKIARGTPGFSGADLANVINQAALRASKDNKDMVDLKSLEWAKEKIMMGAERPNAVIKEEVRRNTAYHEAGHALCAILAEGAMPLYKATIVPRGQSLGMVQQLPEDDQLQVTKKEMRARMIVAMGGYAAEELMYGKDNVSTGPSSDLEAATDMARRMVMKHAFSDKVGPISIDKAVGAQGAIVDDEIRRLCQEALDEARNLLSKNHIQHKRIAEALLEYETLDAAEIRKVMNGEKLSMVGV